MVKSELPSQDVPAPVKTAKCKLNLGVFDSFANRIHHPSRIWVNDTLNAAVGIFSMKMALAAIIKTIVVAVGNSNTCLSKCSLAMDKWVLLIIAEHQPALGLISINTRKMMVALTMKYLADTLNVIQTT